MKKNRRYMAFFFAALLLAAVAELLPLSLFAAFGEAHAPLARRALVLCFAAVAVAAVLASLGHGRLLSRFSRPLPRGTRAACLLLFLVALNNFPFYTLARGMATVTPAPLPLLAYVLSCLFTAVTEELLFRGFLFPAILSRLPHTPVQGAAADEQAAKTPLGDDKHRLLAAVVLSSLLFGLVHLFNLAGGASLPATLLQIGYSTLIGAAAALLLLISGSLWIPVIFHFIYNLGGLFVPTFGSGRLDPVPVVVSTALLALLAAGYAVYALFRVPAENAALLLPDTRSQNAQK